MVGKRSLPQLFALVGALICIAALVIFGSVHLKMSIDRLARVTEDSNTTLAMALSVLVRRDFGGWIATAAAQDPATISADPQTSRLHAAIAGMTRGTRVVKVKI
ncbi:MAG: hypothetical protein FJX56_05595 [Alphaproteobacteria bacterium]|nr:hypothetical protein [Alphaproteobacteria bacterium]